MGLPCDPPPTFSSVFLPIWPDTFNSKFFLNPDYSEMNKFWNSRFFMMFFIYYIVFRVSREYSKMIASAFGISVGIISMINISIVFEFFRRNGYECTCFFSLVMYLVYFFLISLIPIAARTPVISDALPEIKEIPAADRTPGVNHCRRLAVCRHSPVFDNHKFQVDKYKKCIECAKKNPPEGFRYDASEKECQSSAKSNDASKCYKCMPVKEMSMTDCIPTSKECADVFRVADIIDPLTTDRQAIDGDEDGLIESYTDRSSRKHNWTEACLEENASLCWFIYDNLTKKYFGWVGTGSNYNTKRLSYNDLSDPKVYGKGYPTKAICESEETVLRASGGKCTRANVCKHSSELLARCVCKEYKDTSKFTNPCEFLQNDCDIKSTAYVEAEMRMTQADINVSDIVSADDTKRFVRKLDNVVDMLP